MRTVLCLLLLSACSSVPKPDFEVGAVSFSTAGRPNSQGATCEVSVTNRSNSTVQRQCRVVYYSHTGAELLYPSDAWVAVNLAPGETRKLTHTCPFRTAKRAVLDMK